MPYPVQPWRDRLQPASYGGAQFFVELDGQAGGRRNAVHEFPHRDTPWAEDMGRRARRWQIQAYCIGPFYFDDRDALIRALEQQGPATLVHPSLGQMQANCDDYFCTERREQGGYCVFELRFVEAGQQPGTEATADTQSQSNTAAGNAEGATGASLDSSLSAGPGGIGHN